MCGVVVVVVGFVCGVGVYIAHKNLPHKTLRVHSARYTQCIHVSSRKLKLPKDMHSYPPTPFQKWNYT